MKKYYVNTFSLAICLLCLTSLNSLAHAQDRVKSKAAIYKEADFSTASDTCIRIKVDPLRGYHAVGIVCSQADWIILLKNKDKIECWVREDSHMRQMSLRNIGGSFNFIDYVQDAYGLFNLSSEQEAVEVYVIISKELMSQLKNTRSIVVLKSPNQMGP